MPFVTDSLSKQSRKGGGLSVCAAWLSKRPPQAGIIRSTTIRRIWSFAFSSVRVCESSYRGPGDERGLLEEDPVLGEGHGVQEGGQRVVLRAQLAVQVAVAPVHEQHLVQRERVRLHNGHDAVRRLRENTKASIRQYY
eukprot:1176216-Prorocentrum_minimum.AAC.1